MSKIGFIGCGNMATAFIDGITTKGNISFRDIFIHSRTKNKAKKFISNGAVWCDTITEITLKSDFIFVCVKPQQANDVLAEMANSLNENTVVVTMLAGKTIDFFRNFLGDKAQIIRIMPNTPLLIGRGAVALSADCNVDKKYISYITQLISSMGVVKQIPEEQMNTIVAVNGSSPAYFYLFIKIISEWAESHGVDKGTAFELAVNSMLGSAHMLLGDRTPDELIKAVSSPGGTTLAALGSFESDSLRSVFENALNACEKRSAELSQM